ncbi:ATP-binding protein [Streptosporangium vulgare]|uniref:ATP-binding protein n=1 Tax=Streptosporangium vulgare TaxID=46190 RepID=UPI0031E01723
MAHKLLDITPTPDVLVALTRTPITPLDALSELIDNAIDSFHAAEIAGESSPVRHVVIEVPGLSKVERSEGVIRVRDTGPGLTEQHIANAMRAGYTSKNHFDNLGLFGMGFNIATGKLGKVTQVISARAGDAHAVRVTLDLPELVRSGTFEVTAEEIEKPPGLEHGTIVEIRGWWPNGDANHGFIREVARMPKATLRDRIGRRYATMLRGDSERGIRITVNGELCRAFEHCVWSDKRFVERSKYGKIPALIRIDKELGRSRRCLYDGVDFRGASSCPRCGRTESREIPQRVHGWVGIQRFDDKDDYGIDLVRNGRAIRTDEKEAFFVHVDPVSGKSEREYPIDGQYGRIVGEIHLDHVPVDFQKQNFQTATEEWASAIALLRQGSLLPSKWPEGHTNDSPVSLLYQGYRRVRNFGRADMYMGVYNSAKQKAERIPRDTEKDFYRRFLQRQPGYYDDARWWEFVEQANEPPIEELPECPTCMFQNVKDAETCIGCGDVLIGRSCLNADCRRMILRSAATCPHCDADQNPEVRFPWHCAVCQADNKPGEDRCETCGSPEGSPHPASTDVLRERSEIAPNLGARTLVVTLGNGKQSSPLDVTVHAVYQPIIASYGRPPVPLVTQIRPGMLIVFVDLTHPVFASSGLRPEYLIAGEAAQYIYQLHPEMHGKPGHNVAVLTTDLLMQGWGDAVTDNPDTVREEIRQLFNDIIGRILDAPNASDFYDELPEAEQLAMAKEMISAGVDLAELGTLKKGGYLKYCSPRCDH